MTLTPEQFNKLSTKEDLDKFKQEMRQDNISKKDFHSLMDVVIKKLDNIEHSFISNMAAHDRFEESIVTLKDKVAILEQK